MMKLEPRPWGALDFLGSLLLGLSLFVLFIAGGLRLLNVIGELEEGATEFTYQAAVLLVWCLIFRGTSNAFVRGFKRRWRETHEDRRGWFK